MLPVSSAFIYSKIVANGIMLNEFDRYSFRSVRSEKIKLSYPLLPNTGSNNVKVNSKYKYETKKMKNVTLITFFLFISGVLHNIRLPIYENTQNIPTARSLIPGRICICVRISAIMYADRPSAAVK